MLRVPSPLPRGPPGTGFGWNMLIDWLAFRIPRLQSLLEPPPLLLIDNGRVLWRHLRLELLSETELTSKLRDGQITVLKKIPATSSSRA